MLSKSETVHICRLLIIRCTRIKQGYYFVTYLLEICYFRHTFFSFYLFPKGIPCFFVTYLLKIDFLRHTFSFYSVFKRNFLLFVVYFVKIELPNHIFSSPINIPVPYSQIFLAISYAFCENSAIRFSLFSSFPYPLVI